VYLYGQYKFPVPFPQLVTKSKQKIKHIFIMYMFNITVTKLPKLKEKIRHVGPIH